MIINNISFYNNIFLLAVSLLVLVILATVVFIVFSVYIYLFQYMRSKRDRDFAYRELRTFVEEYKRIFKEQISKLSAEHFENYNETSKQFIQKFNSEIDSEGQKNLRALEDLSLQMRNKLSTEIETITDSLTQKTIAAESLLEQRIAAEYQKAEKEISYYKELKVKKLDTSIYELLQDVSMKIFGKTLNIQDHQDLVMKALEEAKKDGVFK